MSTDTRNLRNALATGQLDLEEYYKAWLASAVAREATLKAFVSIEEAQVLQQAEQLTRARKQSEALGPLFGLGVGVKDIIDVEGFPTGFGLASEAAAYPLRDSAIVRRLRSAGALIAGKTVTTPLASRAPSHTRHPIDPERSPGGSSSGSAAAVAAGLLPLALGTQTNGSVIRPAAFCGVPAFKPSFGLIPRTGTLIQSNTLDQIGVFARDLDGIAQVTECLMGEDGHDTASHRAPRLSLLAGLHDEWTRSPRFAVVIPPAIGEASEAMGAALHELLEFLGPAAERVQYDYLIEDCMDAHSVIHAAEIAHHYQPLLKRHSSLIPDGVLEQIKRGEEITASRYLAALALRERGRAAFQDTFDDFDVILSLSALDTAPATRDSTGDPRPCTPWSLLGFPALHVPLFVSEEGMPMGVQLVGAPWQDGRVLRAGQWLMSEAARG
jgi:Asp-tRNA(Asn)/Glu-tRNA(Gln) amidotransferase A subunit family amidase